MIVAQPADAAPLAVVAALGVGVILFVGASALAYWRLTGQVPVARLGASALLVFALTGVNALTPLPGWLFVAVAVVLGMLIVIEERAPARG